MKLCNNGHNAVTSYNINQHREEPNHSAKCEWNKMESKQHSHRECKGNSNIPFKYASILK